ncbi:MAG: site-2 protease family protein [Pirellulales bacterium]
MREQVDWTIPLGTWQGLPVRLHAHFLLFGAAVLYMAQVAGQQPTGVVDTGLLWLAAASLLVLYLSLAAHELAHFWVAKRQGGATQAIIIGPIGGLSEWEVHDDPKSEIYVHLAGPLCNLFLALVPSLAVLRYLEPQVSVAGLLDPLQPQGLPVGGGLSLGAIAGLSFWINWTLFLINLFPAYPFDGGSILRATVRLSRPQLSRDVATLLVARLARLAALGLAVTAFLVRNEPLEGPIAPWFALSVVAGVVLFTGLRMERRAMAELSAPSWLAALARPAFDAPRERQEETSDDRSEIDSDAFVEAFEEEWDERLRQRDREADEERQVDEILARLHQVGLDQLTADERALLERVSARYRSRANSKRPADRGAT